MGYVGQQRVVALGLLGFVRQAHGINARHRQDLAVGDGDHGWGCGRWAMRSASTSGIKKEPRRNKQWPPPDRRNGLVGSLRMHLGPGILPNPKPAGTSWAGQPTLCSIRPVRDPVRTNVLRSTAVAGEPYA